jgi:PHD/YefM family antitoxin component YafN of YafNO toxin-antitoxin module
VITGPDGVVEVIVSLSEYQQLKAEREELQRLRKEEARNEIAAQMREGLAQYLADPSTARTLTREDLLREDVFDRP